MAQTAEDERLRRAGFEVPIRVDAPILPPGIVILVLAAVGLIVAIPAALIGAVCAALDVPFSAGFVVSWSVAVGAYVVRMIRSRNCSRFILYGDRLVSRYPHPRRLRLVMQEEVLNPEEVRHLERSGHRIMLRHGRGTGWMRIDVEDAGGLWAALREWRMRADGLYSWREAGGAVTYSQPPLEDAGPERPFEVAVQREGFARWRLEGSGVRIILERQQQAGFAVVAVSPPSLAVGVYVESNGVYELRRDDGLVLGTWRSAGRDDGELTVVDLALSVGEDAILEGGREIGHVERDAGWVSVISFARVPRALAELAAVLITAVSNESQTSRRSLSTPSEFES